MKQTELFFAALYVCINILQVLPEYQAQISQQARKQGRESDISKIFNKYDVVETSYHFLSQRIDLHLCDDPGGKERLCFHSLSCG